MCLVLHHLALARSWVVRCKRIHRLGLLSLSREHFIEPTQDIVRVRLLGRWLLLFLLLLLLSHHHLLLLHLLCHSLLHLHHHRVGLLAHHASHLLLHHHLWHGSLRLRHRLCLSLGLGLRLRVLVRWAHHVEKVDRGLFLGGLSSTTTLIIIAFVIARLLAWLHVDVAWNEKCLLRGLTGNKLLRHASILNSVVAIESLVQVVVDDEAHGHDGLVVDLTNRLNHLGLQLRQRPEKIIQSFALLSWLRRIDDLVREVDVTFNQVHVGDKLFEFRVHVFRRLPILRGTFTGLLWLLLGVCCWNVREAHSTILESSVDLLEYG